MVPGRRLRCGVQHGCNRRSSLVVKEGVGSPACGRPPRSAPRKAAPSPWSLRVSVPHDCELRVATFKIRPNLGAAITATPADEPRLEIGEPYTVRPAVGVQSNVMAAMAIDQHAANAHLPHLADGDLARSTVGMRRHVASGGARHASIKPASHAPCKLSIPSGSERA